MRKTEKRQLVKISLASVRRPIAVSPLAPRQDKQNNNVDLSL